jgi:monofunctional glycosyltransferase
MVKSKPRKPARGRARTAMDRLAGGVQRAFRWAGIALAALTVLLIGWVTLYRFVDPPGGVYMWQEARRLGEIRREWVPINLISPNLARAVVAAEDANFCLHGGFDLDAIRTALDAGAQRGASTLTQQMVKNVFLWQGRSWLRKGLEAALTPLVELIWSKQRILEVYLNVAEFDTGVFGVEAGAQTYFNRAAADVTLRQAALMAAVLPAPQLRSAARPNDFVSRRATAIMDGAATIARDGRAACFGG